jgi:bifunctional UDP-N-acetylglucosamine pyrophosphorylase / glucosamine-1-phosphate N-acetyltransferase
LSKQGERHKLGVVILAAGRGTRMNSDLPKVLHPLLGRPMIAYVLDVVAPLEPWKLVVIVGYRGDMVKEIVGDRVLFAEQQRRLGTGHAVLQAQQAAADCDAIMVLYGDMPLVRADTLERLWQRHRSGAAPITMLVLRSSISRGFGRILRGPEGQVTAIVEEADCTREQLAIDELNPGVYCFDADWLWEHLNTLPLHPDKGEAGEYYLTDLVAAASAEGNVIQDVVSIDAAEATGVNTPDHLLEAEEGLRRRMTDDI